MVERYSDSIDALRTAALVGPGETAPALRQAVAGRSAEAGRPGEPATSVPDDLVAYVDKVALHAYKVVDADIDRLEADGYSEDQIFEVTVSASVGAALERLERGRAALRGVEQ